MTACIYCREGDLVKNGKRYNKNITKQLYFCKACNRKFTKMMVSGRDNNRVYRYYWHAKDNKTKFKFSGNLTTREYEKGSKPLFKQIKQRCYEQFMQRKDNKPIRFVTDGLEWIYGVL